MKNSVVMRVFFFFFFLFGSILVGENVFKISELFVEAEMLKLDLIKYFFHF